MTINDETAEVAGQTIDGRTPPLDALEMARAAEQSVDDRVVGRGGERT